MRDRIRVNGVLYEAAQLFSGKKKFYLLVGRTLYVFMDEASMNDYIENNTTSYLSGRQLDYDILSSSDVNKLNLNDIDSQVESIYLQKRVRPPRWLTTSTMWKNYGIYDEDKYIFSSCFNFAPDTTLSTKEIVLMGNSGAENTYDEFEDLLGELESCADELIQAVNRISGNSRTAMKAKGHGKDITDRLAKDIKDLKGLTTEEWSLR